MNSSNKTFFTLLKASTLAFCLFWIQVAFVDIDTIFVIGPYIIFSFILIFIICTLIISVSILIIYYSARDILSDEKIFEKFFPYSAILIFCFCAGFVISSGFKNFVCIFFITVFFTLMQSWVWICSPSDNDIKT